MKMVKAELGLQCMAMRHLLTAFFTGLWIARDYPGGFPEANQALRFDGVPMEEGCTLSDDLAAKIELTHKPATDLQLCVTDLMDTNHVLHVSSSHTSEHILAQLPLVQGMLC